jgi:hypothetical protein
MINYSNLKIGDIVTPEYITGNQRHITLGKEYSILNIRYGIGIRTFIKIQNDEGKKVWFNDFQSLSNFKLVNQFSKETLIGNSNIEIQNSNSQMILLNSTLVNINQICTAEIYYEIRKLPGYPEMKDSFRIGITFINSKSITVFFDSKEDLEQAFNKLK